MKDVPSPHRFFWPWLLRVLLLWPLLVSCSALQITYSTLDWILLWKLDSYFDLSASQEKYLDREIKNLHVWHRHHQLPEYQQILSQLDQLWANGLSRSEIEIIFASVDNFRIHLAKHASLPGAIFLSTVTPIQIRHFQEVLGKEHRRLVSDIGTESEEQLTRRITSTLETLTSWVGELSEDQQTYIRQWIAEVPDTAVEWLAHRKRRQGRLLELLRASHDPFTLEQGLYYWLADSKTGATPEFLVASREWREGIKKVVLEIDQILTRDQRVHFSRKLQRLIRDIRGLVGSDNKKPLGV